jgi:hypothetical protein
MNIEHIMAKEKFGLIGMQLPERDATYETDRDATYEMEKLMKK